MYTCQYKGCQMGQSRARFPAKGGGCILEVSFNGSFSVYGRPPHSSGLQTDLHTQRTHPHPKDTPTHKRPTNTQWTHPHRVHNTAQVLGLLAPDTAQLVVSTVVSTGLQSPLHLGTLWGGGGGVARGLAITILLLEDFDRGLAKLMQQTLVKMVERLGLIAVGRGGNSLAEWHPKFHYQQALVTACSLRLMLVCGQHICSCIGWSLKWFSKDHK